MAKNATQEVATTAPGTGLPGLHHELERLFDRRWPSAFGWPGLPDFRELSAPSVDVLDRATDILVRAELPGFSKDDILEVVVPKVARAKRQRIEIEG